MSLRYRHLLLIVLVATTLALAACGRTSRIASDVQSDTGIWVLKKKNLLSNVYSPDDEGGGESYSSERAEYSSDIDEHGNTVSVLHTFRDTGSDPVLSRIDFTRDENGFRQSLKEYYLDDEGKPLDGDDQEVFEETYECTFNDKGQLTRRETKTRDGLSTETQPSKENVDFAKNGEVFECTYDEAGNIKSVTEQSTMSNGDNAPLTVVTHKTVYDSRGLKIAESRSTSNSANREGQSPDMSIWSDFKWELDSAGRPTKSIGINEEITIADTYEYDENGNVRRRTSDTLSSDEASDKTLLHEEETYEWIYIEHPSLAARTHASMFSQEASGF